MKVTDRLDESELPLGYASAAASATADPETSDASPATTWPSPHSDDEESVQEEIGYLLNLQQRREIFAKYNRRVQPGEVVANFSWDMARCECPPSHRVAGVPCITVAHKDGRERCLGCGKFWRTPMPGDRRKDRIPKRRRAK